MTMRFSLFLLLPASLVVGLAVMGQPATQRSDERPADADDPVFDLEADEAVAARLAPTCNPGFYATEVSTTNGGSVRCNKYTDVCFSGRLATDVGTQNFQIFRFKCNPRPRFQGQRCPKGVLGFDQKKGDLICR